MLDFSADHQLILASSALYGGPKWDGPGFKYSSAELDCECHGLEYIMTPHLNEKELRAGYTYSPHQEVA